jgi:hypothetical protein
MNYNYGETFLEINCPSGNIRRIKISEIYEIAQVNDAYENKPCVYVYYGNSKTLMLKDWTLKDFDEKVKTIVLKNNWG